MAYDEFLADRIRLVFRQKQVPFEKGVDLDSGLEYWIDLALKFNPNAKSSKKK